MEIGNLTLQTIGKNVPVATKQVWLDHDFKWVVDKEASAAATGSKHEECKTCGYKKSAVTIPVTTEPSKPNPDTGNGDTKNPKTGDNSNLALWIALMLASCGGILGAAFYGKKKKE